MPDHRRTHKTLYKGHRVRRARCAIHARTWAYTALAAAGITLTVLAVAWLVVDFATRILLGL